MGAVLITRFDVVEAARFERAGHRVSLIDRRGRTALPVPVDSPEWMGEAFDYVHDAELPVCRYPPSYMRNLMAACRKVLTISRAAPQPVWRIKTAFFIQSAARNGWVVTTLNDAQAVLERRGHQPWSPPDLGTFSIEATDTVGRELDAMKRNG